LWTEVFADWYWVPAFGDKPSIHAHERAAEAQGRFAANANVVLPKQDVSGAGKFPGFVYSRTFDPPRKDVSPASNDDIEDIRLWPN
jgi:hypothetical protein